MVVSLSTLRCTAIDSRERVASGLADVRRRSGGTCALSIDRRGDPLRSRFSRADLGSRRRVAPTDRSDIRLAGFSRFVARRRGGGPKVGCLGDLSAERQNCGPKICTRDYKRPASSARLGTAESDSRRTSTTTPTTSMRCSTRSTRCVRCDIGRLASWV